MIGTEILKVMIVDHHDGEKNGSVLSVVESSVDNWILQIIKKKHKDPPKVWFITVLMEDSDQN